MYRKWRFKGANDGFLSWEVELSSNAFLAHYRAGPIPGPAARAWTEGGGAGRDLWPWESGPIPVRGCGETRLSRRHSVVGKCADPHDRTHFPARNAIRIATTRISRAFGRRDIRGFARNSGIHATMKPRGGRTWRGSIVPGNADSPTPVANWVVECKRRRLDCCPPRPHRIGPLGPRG